jgi:arsenate reductase
MDTKIYYNPKCSKCRRTLALIKERGIEPTIIAYLEDPPSNRRLTEMVDQLGVGPKELVRFKERAAMELGLCSKDIRADTEWIDILSQNPSLIERPIVVHGGKAVIGRPPEKVLDILQ